MHELRHELVQAMTHIILVRSIILPQQNPTPRTYKARVLLPEQAHVNPVTSAECYILELHESVHVYCRGLGKRPFLALETFFM